MFLLVTAVVSILVVIWVVLPLVRSNKQDESPDLQSVNAKLLEDQLAELDVDLEQGVIDQAEHSAAKVDLQRTFLETASQKEIDASQHGQSHTLLILALAIALPSLAYFVYYQVGTNPNQIQYMADRVAAQQATKQVAQQASNQQAVASSQEDPHAAQGGVNVSEMVERVRQKAMNNPDDLESWRMLAQSLQVMKDYDGAGKAYLHLINKGVKEADIYSRYGDILAAQSGGILVDSPAYQWTIKALEIDPNHKQSLWIAGTAAYYSKDYGLAKKYWSHLLSLLQPGTETYEAIKQNLQEVSKDVNAQ